MRKVVCVKRGLLTNITKKSDLEVIKKVQGRKKYCRNGMSASSNTMVNSPHFINVMKQLNTAEAKLSEGIAETTGLWTSAPLIEVTSFDDDAYNEHIQKMLEDSNWGGLNESTATRSGVAATENLSAKQSSEGECGKCDHSTNYNALSSGDQNVVERSIQEITKNKSRKSSNRSVMSSQATNGKIVKTKVESNCTINKQRANSCESDQINAHVPKILAPIPSLSGSGDAPSSDVKTSPAVPRRRYTFSSFPGENNSLVESPSNSALNNRRTSTPVIQNGRDKKPTSETINNRKKPERIYLSFTVDPTTSSSQSSPTRKRSQSNGSSHSEEKSHAFDETLPTDEVLRTYEDGRRANNEGQTAIVESPPRSPREPFSKTHTKIAETSMSVMKDAGAIPNRSPTQGRRISTSIMQGRKSSSLDIAEKPSSLTRSHSDVRPELKSANLTQRLNLASSSQSRKLRSPKLMTKATSNQSSGEGRSLSTSQTDLRKFIPNEEDAEGERCVSASTPPLVHKFGDMKTGASVDVSSNSSFSKSETDLRKLVPEEEKKDTIQSPRLRRVSATRLQSAEENGAGCSPLSPREERKIYLAAAQPIARLSKRAKCRSDLQASSQFIIDQAEKELDKFSERLPHISMEQVMKSWQTDRRHWNVVSTVVNPYGENNDSKTNMKGVKDCRYLRESVVTKKKKKHSQKI